MVTLNQKKSIMKRKMGFTLIEACLTLAIFCSLIMVGNFQIQQFQSNLEKRLALRNFESKWDNALTYAYLHHQNLQIDFSPKRITFVSERMKFNDVIIMPNNLICDDHRIITVNTNGTVRPQTIHFSTTDRPKKKYFYTVEMNWGVLVAKKT